MVKRRQACATRPLSLRSFKPEKEVLSRGKHRALEISRQSRLQPSECNILSVHLLRLLKIQKKKEPLEAGLIRRVRCSF